MPSRTRTAVIYGTAGHYFFLGTATHTATATTTAKLVLVGMVQRMLRYAEPIWNDAACIAACNVACGAAALNFVCGAVRCGASQNACGYAAHCKRAAHIRWHTTEGNCCSAPSHA